MATVMNSRANGKLQLIPASALPLPEPTPEQAIEQQAHAVQAARRLHASLDAKVKAGRKQWDADHASLLEARDLAREGMDQRVSALKAMGVTAFHATGSKHPGAGITVKMMKRAVYALPVAEAWALDKKLFLVFDQKGFDSFAVKNPKQVPFVEVLEEPEATLPTDLAAALAEKEIPDA